MEKTDYFNEIYRFKFFKIIVAIQRVTSVLFGSTPKESFVRDRFFYTLEKYLYLFLNFFNLK
jgi:hypothetical protein